MIILTSAPAALIILTSVPVMDGLPERVLSVTHVLQSSKFFYYRNTAASLIVSSPYSPSNNSSVQLPLFIELTPNSITPLLLKEHLHPLQRYVQDVSIVDYDYPTTA